MSLNRLPQYNEAVPSQNPDRSVDQEQQGSNLETKNPFRKENFWCSLKKNLPCLDKCFPFLQSISSPSSRSLSCFQQLHEVLARRSAIESCPRTSRATDVPPPAVVTPANFNPPAQKLNLNTFLALLLCACIPVGSCSPQPTKIMVCLPCPPPGMASAMVGVPCPSKNKCEPSPFCVPRKLDDCSGRTSRRGKYLPPPVKRECPPGCLHVSDLKTVRPCMADRGCPCVAHCFESHPKCTP